MTTFDIPTVTQNTQASTFNTSNNGHNGLPKFAKVVAIALAIIAGLAVLSDLDKKITYQPTSHGNKQQDYTIVVEIAINIILFMVLMLRTRRYFIQQRENVYYHIDVIKENEKTKSELATKIEELNQGVSVLTEEVEETLKSRNKKK